VGLKKVEKSQDVGDVREGRKETAHFA